MFVTRARFNNLINQAAGGEGPLPKTSLFHQIRHMMEQNGNEPPYLFPKLLAMQKQRISEDQDIAAYFANRNQSFIDYVFSFLPKEELSILLDGCYSELIGFIVVGCPRSTDTDVIVIVSPENQPKGQVLPLSPDSLRQLQERLFSIGINPEKELDINLIYLDKGRVIGFSKGGQETVNIIHSTWMYHPQEMDGLTPRLLKYIDPLEDEKMRDIFPRKVMETARWSLKRLKELMQMDHYQSIRQEKNTILANPGSPCMHFFINISSMIVLHPKDLGSLNEIKWRNNIKSLTMKLIQVVLWFKCEQTCYLKVELAERCIPIIFGDDSESLVQEALFYLLRGTAGALPRNSAPELIGKLILLYQEVVVAITADNSIELTIPNFSRFESSLTENLKPFLPLFVQEPINYLPSFERDWTDADMNSFEMDSASEEEFHSNVSDRLSEEQISYLKEHFIMINQRSEEWHHFHKFYDCGNSIKVQVDGFMGKYNLIRGNFIEMMVQHYIDLIFLQLCLENVYAFTLGFVVLEKEKENSPGSAPDLLAVTEEGVLYIIEIKGLKSMRPNNDFYRAYYLAKKQTECVERILGNRIVKIKKLVILGMIQNQALHLKLYQF